MGYILVDTRSFDQAAVSRQGRERELAGSGSGPQAPSSEPRSGVSVRGGTSSRSWREKSHRAENPMCLTLFIFREVFTKSLAVLSIPHGLFAEGGSVCRGAWGRRARCVSFCRGWKGRWGHGRRCRAAREVGGPLRPRVWGLTVGRPHVLDRPAQGWWPLLCGEVSPRGPRPGPAAALTWG